MVKGNEGVRFENMVAVCLLKHLNAVEDYEGKRTELQYLRTKEKKEVDFAMVKEGDPVLIMEVKLSDSDISPSLRYFHRKYGLKAMQIVKQLRQEQMVESIELRRADDFLKTLKL